MVGTEIDYFETKEWRGLRWKALKRDHFKCKRCETRFPHGRGLTAHHIIPQRKGGADDLSNLVSLCNACHNLVEGRSYRTIAEIATIDARPVEDSRLSGAVDWRMWVYGGYRNPALENVPLVERSTPTAQGQVSIELPPLPSARETRRRQKAIEEAYRRHVLEQRRKPKPEPKPEPRVRSMPDLSWMWIEPKPKPKPEPESKPKTEAKPKPKPKYFPKPKPKPKPEPKPIPKIEPGKPLSMKQIAHYLRVGALMAEQFTRNLPQPITIQELDRYIAELSTHPVVLKVTPDEWGEQWKGRYHKMRDG